MEWVVLAVVWAWVAMGWAVVAAAQGVVSMDWVVVALSREGVVIEWVVVAMAWAVEAGAVEVMEEVLRGASCLPQVMLMGNFVANIPDELKAC